MSDETSSALVSHHAGSQMLDRALVAAFLEHIPDSVYFKDRESRFIAVSKSKALRHGLPSPEMLLGKSDKDFFSDAHCRRSREVEERIMSTGEPLISKLEKISWANGRETWALSSKLPLRNQQGQIIGTFGVTKDVTEEKQMEIALEKAQRDLVDTSRRAGMAEVATGVLHNVGNVLNSLNVSATMIANGLKHSKSESLVKLATLLRSHAEDLGSFMSNDSKGRRVPEFLTFLTRTLDEERAQLMQELESLQKNVDHIKEIVSMQQAYATMVGVVESLDAETLMEDSLRMNAGALVRHSVRVERDYQPVPRVRAEKAKVLQILVNLIRNAKYAADEGGSADKLITLRVGPGAGPGRVQLVVQDNGIGIPPENLSRIFEHGFTTRATGHGFGLHSSLTVAKDMQGTLTVQSEGTGKGATFVLDLPAAEDTPATSPSASK